MLLADVVTTSGAVTATRSRTGKAAAVADLMRRAAPSEVAVVAAWLTGEPRQGRTGVGWRTLAGHEPPPEAAGVPAPEDLPAADPAVAGLTVTDVDDALTALAGVSGAGAASRRDALLADLLGRSTPAEHHFLVRLLTGELRQGALEGVVLDGVIAASGAPAALVRRAAMLSGSLPVTAATAMAGGAAALEAVRLQVGRPVRPMLASPGTDLAAALGTADDDGRADVVVEPKLDGARIQVHLDRRVPAPGDVRVWTRTLREVTDHLPEVAALVRRLPCTDAVLDGETLALDDDGRPRPFQETMSRFGSEVRSGDEGGPALPEVVLSPFFFDLLHVDGRDLLDEPLAARLDALASLLAAPEHAPLRMPGVRGPDAAAAQAVLDGALAAGHEGVVVKDLGAPYAAGRRGSAWRKVKPVHTLDLVVLGAEWGYGRRTGRLSNIHLGARDPDGGPPVMVGKTFKGMTDELLAWQTETFPGLVDPDAPHAAWGVLLRPELVVEIAVDGAQRSTRYPGGVALRFARVLRYRPDRTAADADTLDAVRALLA